MLLRREGTWNFVDPGVPPVPATAAWAEGDSKARATIALLVEDSQHNLIMAKTTAKATWDALKSHHRKATLTGKVSLLKEICSTNYVEGQNMEEFLYGMEELYSRLENAGEKMSPYMQVAMILRSLPKEFGALTTALESRSDKELTMELVRAKLIDESEKLYGENGKVQEERALKARNEPKPAGACFFCGQVGHKKRDCKEFLARRNAGSSNDQKNKAKQEENAKQVREYDTRSYTFVVRRNDNRDFAHSWLIDTGASSHMCSDKSAFSVIEYGSRSSVIVADGGENHVEGIGDCLINCSVDSGKTIKLTLRGVLFVPTLEGNVISIGKLASKGVRAVFDNTSCKLEYESTVVAVADKVSDIYWLRVATEDRVLKSEERRHIEHCYHTWQHRSGHRKPDVFAGIKRHDLATARSVVKDPEGNGEIEWTFDMLKKEDEPQDLEDVSSNKDDGTDGWLRGLWDDDDGTTSGVPPARYCEELKPMQRGLVRFGLAKPGVSKYPRSPGISKQMEENGQRIDSPDAYRGLKPSQVDCSYRQKLEWAGNANARGSLSWCLFGLEGGLTGWCCHGRNGDNLRCAMLNRSEREAGRIERKCGFIEDVVGESVMELKCCLAEHTEADLLTWPLPAGRPRRLPETIDLMSFSVEEEC